MRIAIVIFLLVVSSVCLAQSVVIRCTGNMGVWIQSGTTQVLIDGFHLPYDQEYLPPPAHLLDSLIHSKGRYRINVALFTHRHNDHFNESPVNEFLRLNSASSLMAPIQVIDKIDQQWKSRTISSNMKSTYQLSALVKISTLPIDHTWPQRHSAIQNVGYIVEIGSTRIVHLGDADCSEEAFQKSGISKLTFDVAIVPAWFFGNEGWQLAKKYVRAKKYIITHISPLSNPFTERLKLNIEKSGTDAAMFRKVGEQIEL